MIDLGWTIVFCRSGSFFLSWFFLLFWLLFLGRSWFFSWFWLNLFFFSWCSLLCWFCFSRFFRLLSRLRFSCCWGRLFFLFSRCSSFYWFSLLGWFFFLSRNCTPYRSGSWFSFNWSLFLIKYELLDSGYWAITGTADYNAIPEPATWALFLLGVFGLLYSRKRK